MKADSFSVVVPTHNRSDLVAALLASLATAQMEFPGEVEILVIDSSADDTALAIQDLCAKHSARYLRCTNHVTQKRNLGLHEARCEYVLFTDSDCEVQPDLLSQHARAYESAEEDVGGVLGLTMLSGDTAPIWETLRLDSSFTTAFAFARWMAFAPWGTCTNLSFRRDALLTVGGFDEAWPLKVYGEDVDLGIRVNKAGFRIRCNPQAIVRHNSASITSIGQVLRKKYLTGRADYHLGKRYPERLSAEFPGWTTIGLLLLLVLSVRSLIVQSPSPMLLVAIALLSGVLCQAILTVMASGTGWRSLLRHAAVILFEATFDAGRAAESLRHGQAHRLWTKFVYAERQLVGERDKRIRQMWACVFAVMCLVVLSDGKPFH